MSLSRPRSRQLRTTTYRRTNTGANRTCCAYSDNAATCHIDTRSAAYRATTSYHTAATSPTTANGATATTAYRRANTGANCTRYAYSRDYTNRACHTYSDNAATCHIDTCSTAHRAAASYHTAATATTATNGATAIATTKRPATTARGNATTARGNITAIRAASQDIGSGA
jgi:hypothetical protein